MLRARAIREPGNSYVCVSCRRHLSSTAGSSRTRFSPAVPTWRRNPTNGPTPLGRCDSDIRFLSTTRPLLAPNDGNPPPRSFPQQGSFGSFGSFASRNTNAANTSSPRILLPHEEAARRKTAVAEEKEPSRDASQPRPKLGLAEMFSGMNRNRGKQHKPGNAGNRDKLSEAQEKSNSALADVFSKKQPRRDPTAARPATPNAFGHQDDNTSQKQATGAATTASTSAPAAAAAGWGAFSDRVTKTSDFGPSTKKPIVAKQAQGKQGSVIEKKPAPKTGASASFWDEMEQRVDAGQSKRKNTKWQAGANASSAQDNPKTEKLRDRREPQEVAPSKERPVEEAPSQRKFSRFEANFDQFDERQAKRSKKPKKGGRGGRDGDRYDDEQWSEVELNRWERQQQRKAEKLRRQKEAAVEAKPLPIFIPEYISVSKLAQALKQRVETFLKDLEEMGFEDLSQDTIMTGETAALVALEYGFEPTVDTGSLRDIRPRPPPEDASALPTCAPVVTIMGHVDHGKTTLLDWLRKSSVAAQEHGGITQHIGAFVVKLSSGKTITFLDTPGHAAFLSMRQRGATVTNIVVLVVAADDSVKPQTLEALKHARDAKVPIIVAITKVDKEDARIQQVKSDLARHGVEIEDYGGDVQVVCVSGKTGEGMDDLEENIVTLSEILDVRAETDGMVEGWILESEVKQDGKVATVLVKRGTLRVGDIVVAGQTWARVRVMRNEAGIDIAEAPPGTPVEILGWRELPAAGEQILQAPDETTAKTAVEYREEMAEREESSKQQAEYELRLREKAAAEAAAEAEEAAAMGEPVKTEPGIIRQNFVVKADVGGSVEAICGAIQELGNNEVQANLLRSSTGQIFEADIDHAAASNSIIINFNSTIQPHIKALAAAAGVKIMDHTVIYHIVDDVKSALSDLLPMSVSHRVTGEADILQIFTINIKKRVTKSIAGCRIRNGSIKKTARARVLRKGQVIYDGTFDTLKHVKKDVQEMGKGTECGIGFPDFEDFQIDDQIQTYEEIKEKRHL
ncbi:hypothetical protein S40293_02696 [Stachybotrys chartarum IBT 40293]|nr:hypothetical protein S40293_02696 [Stachybotrys chartarum IBT 40293]